MNAFLPLQNAAAIARRDIPDLPFADFRAEILSRVEAGGRISAFFAVPEGTSFRLYALLRAFHPSALFLGSARCSEGAYESLTPECPQAQLFEREIFEQYRLLPLGHPWLKPVRGEAPRTGARTADAGTAEDSPPFAPFFHMRGEGVHEVAVGPVHAGVIEPGHFRFQCSGETVHHLEIALGYQHRGIERRMAAASDTRALLYAETLSGDASVAHATAWCRTQEALSGIAVPARAEAIRAIALELERIASHVGDLGALAGDVAFLPTASYCGRLRGEFLNMTAALCGNRFGRSLLRVGGVSEDLTGEIARHLLAWLDRVEPDTLRALDLLFDAPTVLDRFESTGAVSHEDALRIGLVGPAARACGVGSDVRRDLPTGYYRALPAPLPLALEHSGDVLARAKIRYREILSSLAFLRTALPALPDGNICAQPPMKPKSDALALCLEEGWRGELCHIVLTDDSGARSFVKITDPSFHNWFGLALALREQEISDFPICNKSFNLSYCGHDL